MNNSVYKKLSYYIGLIPLGAIFGLLVQSAGVEIKDLDLWLHLAVGKHIFLTGSVPQIDILSCTIKGQPWVNHEWLFQVLVYRLYDLFGPDGLIKMQVVLVSVTMFVLVLLGFSKDKQLTFLVSLLMVYMVYQQRFTIRPDLFSLLFFALYIYVLAIHIDKRWAPAALFVVQVLWSNFHGFFFFGPLFVLIGIVSEFIRRHVSLPYEWNESGALTDEEYKRLRLTFYVVVAACLFNPGFIEGAWYPIGVFFSLMGENKIFFEHIQELQKPVKADTIFTAGRFVHYKALIFLSVVSFLFNRRRIDISAFLFWLVFLVFSLKAVRNISFFAFAAYLVIITNVLNISYKDIFPLRFNNEKFGHITAIVAKILLLAWMFQYMQVLSTRSYYDFDKYDFKSEFGGVTQQGYPDKAVNFLVENNVEGNFFNDFNSGAYLLGHTYPDIKVFIDGRTEVYGADFFKYYKELWDKADKETMDRTLEKYKITGALLNSSRTHIPEPILKYFHQKEGWALVYFGYDGFVFLKDVEKNREIIDEHKIELSSWEAPEVDLVKMGAVQPPPFRHYYRAYSLETLGFYDQALDELNEALSVSPHYPDVHALLGKIYAKKKEHRKAFEHFRIAASFRPRKKEWRHNLALSLLDLNEHQGAIRQYNAVVNLWPDDPKGHFFLAKSYILEKDYEKAMRMLSKLSERGVKSPKDYILLADLLIEKEQYQSAFEVFKLVLPKKKDDPGIHRRMGEISLKLGELKEAGRHFRECLKLDPVSDVCKNELEKIGQSY